MKGERLIAPVVIRCAVLGGIVLLLAVPGYVFAEPAWRAVVARLAVAFVLGVGLLQLRSAVAERLARYAPSVLTAWRRHIDCRDGEPTVSDPAV